MMKSNFLNLPSSASGDARRHVPFRSIINKHISILFVLSFVFSILFSYLHPVYALADPQPEYDPVYNTEIIRLTDYVDNELTPDQQDIFYTMFGAYLVAQGAMQDYLIEDPYTTQDGVWGWFKSCGIQIYNSAIVQNALMAPSVLLRNGIQDLVDFAMGIALKAGLIQDKVTFQNDVLSSDYYFLPFNNKIQLGINQVLATNDGLYNWQFTYNDFVSESNFTWKTISEISDGQDLLYNEYVNTYIDREHVFFANARSSDYYNTIMSSTALHTYLTSHHNLFINMSNHTWALLDDDGNGDIYPVYSSYPVTWVNYYNYNGRGYAQKVENYSLTYYTSYTYDASFTPSQFVAYYLTMSGMQDYNSIYYFNPWLFIEHVYYGLSWDGKTEMLNRSDLNFSDDYQQYYLQVTNDYLLDLKGLIQDLINVTVLKPVIYDNIYDPSGVQTTPATNQVAITVQLPDSGISIPNNLFSPLTKDGGYISYLWYMTKPLVQYTSDFVQTLVFPDNTGEGFDVTGPGAIVFGVISLGLIGGLVVKCLL